MITFNYKNLEENNIKKIISLSIDSEVCALTAISASAAAVTEYAVNGEIKEGNEVTFSLKATGDVSAIMGYLKTEGLEVKGVSYANAGLKNMNEETKLFAVQNMDGSAFAKAGDAIISVTAVVNAKAGETVSFEVEGSSDKYKAMLPTEKFTATVKGATDTSSDSKPADSDTSSESKPTDSTSSESKPAEGDNPGTGVALAVVPVALAAAGVIVAKKRK